ncbi:hypothetical protein EDC01DRAFT_643590 [Geopyxis carbonaria]|nr:hypothetical protein EDC01DRAFT_643590 [Geopyxis carbonaria]
MASLDKTYRVLLVAICSTVHSLSPSIALIFPPIFGPPTTMTCLIQNIGELEAQELLPYHREKSRQNFKHTHLFIRYAPWILSVALFALNVIQALLYANSGRKCT